MTKSVADQAGTARNRDSEPLRDRALKAAILEFGDKGYEGARMDEIARVAGASKQVLYHHFESKEGLFAQALREAYASFRGSNTELLDKVEGLDAEAALRTFVAYIFVSSPETIRFQQLIHDENRFGGVHARALHEARDGYRRLVGVLARILEAGAEDGVFRRGVDATELYVSIVGLFMMRITNAHTLGFMLDIPLDDAAGAERSRETAMRLLLDALRP